MTISVDDITKRMLETKKEIFPLDRLLPLKTVYSIFVEEYAKTKGLILSPRSYGVTDAFIAAFARLGGQWPASKRW